MGAIRTAVAVLQTVLDRRIAFRLPIIVAGMLLAEDRRTASAWFVAAGVQDDWDRFYDCLIWVGSNSAKLATAVLGLVVNPTPGPADGEWLYGHNWVSLAWLATHPLWGGDRVATMVAPVRSRD